MKIFSYPTIGVVSIASIIGIIFGQIDQGGGSVSGDGGYVLVAVISTIATMYFIPWLKEKKTAERLIESQEKITLLQSEIKDSSDAFTRKISDMMEKIEDMDGDRKTMSDLLSGMIKNNTELLSKLYSVMDVISGKSDSGSIPQDISVDIAIGDSSHSDCAGRVLIVEDSPAARAPVVSLLRLRRFYVDSAGTISSAKSMISSSNYDFILLDLMLPDGDGEDILKYVSSSCQGVTVIVTTAKTEEETSHLMKYGPAKIVKKPYQFFKEILPVLEGGNKK